MKKIWIILTLGLLSLEAGNLETLLEQVKVDTVKQLKADKVREHNFLSNLQEAKKRLAQSKKALSDERAETKRLKKQFETQKIRLVKLNARLEKRSDSLKNLFTISQQEAREFASLLKSSMTSTQLKGRDIFLEKLATSRSMPKSSDIRKMWQLYLEEIIYSGQVRSYESAVINAQGAQEQQMVTRVGLFSAFNENEFIRYDDTVQEFVTILRQPSSDSLKNILLYNEKKSAITPILIDPTRGVLFNMLKEKSTIKERVEQGGVIGYVILSLGALTALYAFFKYLVLSLNLRNMKKQLRSESINIKNPLGRVLAAFEKHKSKEITTIESKMDTAILKELPGIQEGLPLIKLVAAVAPLLGLLGTVTGMIETFQSITLFGTGDPKLMAGGISQALMTTVLGLVVAIPLLFVYNVLHAKSKKLIEMLTQQSSALVAKQLEMLDEANDEYRTAQ